MRQRAAAHPGDGELRAYLDGELRIGASLACRLHVRACPRCRLALQRLRHDGATVSELLALVSPVISRRDWPSTTAAWPALAGSAVLAVLLSLFVHRQPATHARVAGSARVQDVCCFNLDGGGRRDDGLLTVSRSGQIVDCVVLYEDRAGTRAFSPSDPLRFISQPSGCTPDVVGAAAGAGS